MLPILSQLWYRSRCRYCGERFSWRYLWVELLTAVLFGVLYVYYVTFGPVSLSDTVRTASAMCSMAFAAALIVIFFIDLEHYKIPDLAILVAVLAAVARDVVLMVAKARPLWQEVPFTPWHVPVPLSLVGCVLAFWALWQFAALTTAALGRESMGAGDALLLGAMAAYLIPWPLVVVAFLLAVSLGTVGGLAGIWLARGQARDEGSAHSAAEATSEPDATAAEPDAAAAEHAAAATDARPSEAGLCPAEALTPPSSEAASHLAATTPVSNGLEAPGTTDPEPARREDTFAHAGVAAVLATRPPGLSGGGPSGGGAFGEGPFGGHESVPPTLPPDSRWGRLWTVIGTWLAVGAVWGGLVVAVDHQARGLALGLALAVLAAVVLYFGIRMWARGDEPMWEAMDEFFDAPGGPGPRVIPFGPYLVTGALLAIFFGRQLIDLYAASVGSYWLPSIPPWD